MNLKEFSKRLDLLSFVVMPFALIFPLLFKEGSKGWLSFNPSGASRHPHVWGREPFQGLPFKRRGFFSIKTRLNCNQGFTLVEILVAVTILGIISSFVYSVLTSSISASRSVEKKMEINHAGRFFISRITRDLSSATILPLSGSGGLIGYHFTRNGKAMDEIHFTSFTSLYYTQRPRINLSEIGYYFLVGSDGGDRFLRRESDIVEGDVDLGGNAMEISDMVEEMKILYLGKGGWLTSWDSATARSLPEAVSVEMTLNDGTGSRLFSGIIRLPS